MTVSASQHTLALAATLVKLPAIQSARELECWVLLARAEAVTSQQVFRCQQRLHVLGRRDGATPPRAKLPLGSASLPSRRLGQKSTALDQNDNRGP